MGAHSPEGRLGECPLFPCVLRFAAAAVQPAARGFRACWLRAVGSARKGAGQAVVRRSSHRLRQLFVKVTVWGIVAWFSQLFAKCNFYETPRGTWPFVRTSGSRGTCACRGRSDHVARGLELAHPSVQCRIGSAGNLQAVARQNFTIQKARDRAIKCGHGRGFCCTPVRLRGIIVTATKGWLVLHLRAYARR